MTSSNGNIFRVTCLLRGEFTAHRWIPHRKTSDAELWSFLWPANERTVEQTVETPMIWDAIALIMRSLQCIFKFRFEEAQNCQKPYSLFTGLGERVQLCHAFRHKTTFVPTILMYYSQKLDKRITFDMKQILKLIRYRVAMFPWKCLIS